uniref:Lymphatic vessel endothelial hyaluronic receptor 1b n=1 Tax=Amphiprion percula TaxID=161767 RepID=A0A3P8T3T9_AMPPE
MFTLFGSSLTPASVIFVIRNMARLCCFSQFLFQFLAVFLLTSESSLIKVSPQSHSVAGVFMPNKEGTYTLNFTAARATCLFLNVTMATRAQMERAVQHGLETCRFGWIAEQIAVVPRLTSNNNCGRGKTGLVTWSALADRKFNVFCFNASDFEETLKTSTTGPQSSTSSATLTTSTLTSRPTTPSVRSTPLVRSTLVVRSTIKPTRKPIITESPEQTPLTSAPLVQTTPSTRISSSTPSSLTPSSTHIAAPLPRLLTSKPAIVSFAFSTSGHASNISLSSESVLSQSVSSAKPSLGVVPTALVVVSIIILLLTAAGAVWYYTLKRNIFTFWSQGQQRDDIETEMWKHINSEMNLHSQGGAEEDDEEEESYRKYSSDITLCVHPGIKANFSE